MLCRIEDASGNARAQWIRGTIRARHPSLGQAQRKDENVEFLDGAANRREMLLPIGAVFRHRSKAVGLNLRPKWVDNSAVRTHPSVIFRLEQAVGAVQKLQKLARCINVSVARRKQPVTVFLRQLRRHERMRGLGHEITEAGVAQMARDMLRKAAAGGCDVIGAGYAELARDDRVNLVIGGLRDRRLPEISLRQRAVWML